MENFLFGIAMLRQADLWLSQLSQAGYVSCHCQLSLPIDGSRRALGRAPGEHLGGPRFRLLRSVGPWRRTALPDMRANAFGFGGTFS